MSDICLSPIPAPERPSGRLSAEPDRTANLTVNANAMILNANANQGQQSREFFEDR